MKKVCFIIFTAFICLTAVATEFTASDARMALRISADLEPYVSSYDLDCDGDITASEARRILIWSAGVTPYVSEATMIAKTMWGEARSCSKEQRAAIGWCILNRVDNDRFPNSVYSVITQPNQFYYSSSFPCTDENYNLACDILARWCSEKNGATVERELPDGYYWYYGNGRVNIFRNAYSGGTEYIP